MPGTPSVMAGSNTFFGISRRDETLDTVLECVAVLLAVVERLDKGSDAESKPAASGVLLLSVRFWLVSLGGVEANLLYLLVFSLVFFIFSLVTIIK